MNCILLALIAIIGIIFLYRGSIILIKLKNINRLEEVKITILNSGLSTGYEKIKYSWIEYFYPDVTYEYEVNGQKICSDKVALEKKGLWTENREEAQKLLDQIIISRMALYDPSNISESVIVPYLSKRRISHNRSLVVSGLMLIGLGIMLCLISAA